MRCTDITHSAAQLGSLASLICPCFRGSFTVAQPLDDLTIRLDHWCRFCVQVSAGESGDWSCSGKKEFSQLSPCISTQTGRSSSRSVEIRSYVRGYHAFWNPVVGQKMLLKREPNNREDLHAVAVLDERVVVGILEPTQLLYA